MGQEMSVLVKGGKRGKGGKEGPCGLTSVVCPGICSDE